MKHSIEKKGQGRGTEADIICSGIGGMKEKGKVGEKSGPYLAGGGGGGLRGQLPPPEIQQRDYNSLISVIFAPPEKREIISALDPLLKKF